MKNNNRWHLFANRTLYLRLLMIAGAIILLTLVAHWFEFYIPRIEIWIRNLGPLAPIAFILLFTVATPFFLSVDALCVAAGVLFPLSAGGFYIIISTYLAATVIFILGRYFFRERINVLLEKQPKLKSLDTVLAEDGFEIMFLLRLLPLPFALLSYALSITRVGFKAYIGSTSGILIYNLSLVYLGYTAKHFTSIAGSAQQTGSVNFPLLILGLFAILLVLALIVQIARNKIAQIDPAMVELNHGSH